jgi:hypothetical protein
MHFLRILYQLLLRRRRRRRRRRERERGPTRERGSPRAKDRHSSHTACRGACKESRVGVCVCVCACVYVCVCARMCECVKMCAAAPEVLIAVLLAGACKEVSIIVTVRTRKHRLLPKMSEIKM